MTTTTGRRLPAGGRGPVVVGMAAGLVLSLAAPTVSRAAPLAAADDGGSLNAVVLLASVVSSGGGTVTPAESRTGSGGPSLRFPTFDPSDSGPRAAVLARSGAGVDVLDPGTSDFTFGATVMLDAESRLAGSADNGNNVVQRGLFGSTSQYKIQVDGTTASCRVMGSAGTVAVSSKTPITPGRWYGLACSRAGSTVSLAVTRWTATGEPRTDVRSVTGATGDMRSASPTVPLSVGAKVHDSGRLTDSCDQFNGVIDDPFVRIGDSVVGIALPAPNAPATPPDPSTPAPAPARIATTTHLKVKHPQAPRRSTVVVKGTVSPGGATHGATVTLRVVKKLDTGKKVVARVDGRVSVTGKFRFRDVLVRKAVYRVVFKRQGVLLASSDVVVYRHGHFHHR